MRPIFKNESIMHLFHLPGFATLLIVASSLSLPSCSKGSLSANADGPIDRGAPVVFDSIQKGKLDQLAMQINEVADTRRKQAKKIPYPAYNPKDSISYLFTEDHRARISMHMHPDSGIIWPYFWVYNGELIIMGLRVYNQVPVRSAIETVVYFDKGKIVYCNERKKILEGNEIPGAVQKEPFIKSTRSYGDLEQLSKKYWSEVLNEMKKQNVLPEWIKS